MMAEASKIAPEHLENLLKSDPFTPNQERLGIADSILDNYYMAATLYLQEKQWDAARDCFTFLVFLNPYFYHFWLGLGIALQSMSLYEEAFVSYALAGALDPEDPSSFANAVQCAIALNDKDLAAYVHQKAVACCANKAEHAALKRSLNSYKEKVDAGE